MAKYERANGLPESAEVAEVAEIHAHMRQDWPPD